MMRRPCRNGWGKIWLHVSFLVCLIFFVGLPSEADALQGEGSGEVGRKVLDLKKKLGLPIVPTESPHFLILSTLASKQAASLSERLERTYKRVGEILKIENPLWKPWEKCLVLVLPNREAYEKYLDLYGKEKEQPPAVIQAMKKARGIYDYLPPMTVDYKGQRPFAEVEANVLHKLGHVLLYRFHFQYNYLPPWLSEAFAVYVEESATGEVLTFCFSPPQYRYGEGLVGESIAEKWLAFKSWPELLASMVSKEEDTPLSTILGLHINSLRYREVAKSWSFLRFLMQKDMQKFISFFKILRQKLPKYEVTVKPSDYRAIQGEIFQLLYGKSIDDLEREWRATIFSEPKE